MRILLQATDEGTLLYGAVRVTEGQVPCRDFFEVMGPGTFYWLAIFFKLLGTTWFASRVALMLTSVTTGVLTYFLTRRLYSDFASVPAILLLATSFGILWPAISHHNDSNLFALSSFAVFTLWLDKRSPVLLFCAGLLAGMTTCFLQPKGALLVVSLLTSVWLLRRKDESTLRWTGAIISGYISVGAGVVYLYLRAGALPDLIYTNVTWPLHNYSHVNAVPYAMGTLDFYWGKWMPVLTSSLSPGLGLGVASILEVPFLFIAALPILLGGLAVRLRSRGFSHATLPYWLSGMAVWLSELHRQDITHLVYGSPLLVILCFHLLSELKSRMSRFALQLISVCAIVLAGFIACVALRTNTEIATRRGSVYSFRADPILSFLDTHVKPGAAIFSYSYCPMYYFLSATKNPTRFSILEYHMNTASEFREVVHDLETSKVKYVVWDNVVDTLKRLSPNYDPPADKQRIVERYLVEHYLPTDVVGVSNSIRLWERRPDLQVEQ